MAKTSDTKYMQLALRLAAKAKDRTYPNPMVGAVIVKGGRIVGKGYHRRAGEDHAEIRAIKDSSGKCRGGTLYITLEPCDHYGKTPPCTQSIIKSGIKKVNIAVKDPNPLNNGRGIRRLRESGIQVNTGMCAEETLALNRKYVKFVTKGIPYITLKLAQSVDGKIAARDGTSKWITSETSRRYARKMRSGFDAVMVGANTVVNDNPLLLGEGKRGNSITRVVVDSGLRIPVSSKLIKTAKRSPVIIATTDRAPKGKLERLRQIKGVDVMVSRGKKVPIRTALKKFAKKGIVNMMVEGGGELAGSLMDKKMVDEVMFFVAPKIIGGNYSSVKGIGAGNIASAVELSDVSFRKSGSDVLIRGLVNKPLSSRASVASRGI
ncbi:MAG: bifunctional diaminohydroxyphosphoribosylaminopyrimidine deaminase/5-amino-6-(5-phosphoribosylamino)uracil reductase RibD [Candidatus Omnitrophota bacterium]